MLPFLEMPRQNDMVVMAMAIVVMMAIVVIMAIVVMMMRRRRRRRTALMMMMITMMTMMTIVMTMIMYSAENPYRPFSRRLDRCDLLIQNNEFKHVGLLPIAYRMEQLMLGHMFNIINGNAPTYLISGINDNFLVQPKLSLC